MAKDDESGPGRVERQFAETARIPGMIIAVGLAAVGVAAIWLMWVAITAETGPRRTRPIRLIGADRPFPAGGRYPGDPFIGSTACARCHPAESASQSRSGHAHTLSRAGRPSVSRRLDGTTVPDPERPGVVWSYRFRDGELQIDRTGDRVEKWIADYAFGSAHHATTFVTVLDPGVPRVLEHRMTYYAQDSMLGITPGQDAETAPPEVKPHGHELKPTDARKCFRCHATQLSARGDHRIDDETMIPNVSCERCHGPGRAHVQAANRGAPGSDLAMPFGPGRWTDDALMQLCGDCHRHPSGARPGQIRPDNHLLARFQPVGIMQSKCFLRSSGTLRCLTCHDPHERASPDRGSYDAKCLLCHQRAGSVAEPGPDRVVASPPCDVAARGACVDCHMPRVNAGQRVLYSDHWIRVRSIPDSVVPISAERRNR